MDRETLKKQLLEMMTQQIGLEFPDLKESDDLRVNMGLDSVDMVTLLIEIQSRLGVNIPAPEAANLKTVGDVLDHLERKLQQRQAA